MMLDPTTISGVLERWCSGGGGGPAWVDPRNVASVGAPRSRTGVAIGSIAAARVQGRPTASRGGFGATGLSSRPPARGARPRRRRRRWRSPAGRGVALADQALLTLAAGRAGR